VPVAELGHGLYLVTRGGDLFVLSGAEWPTLGELDRSVVSMLLLSAKTLIGAAMIAESELRRGEPAGLRTGPVEDVSGVGVYYVPTDGRGVYPLTGPEATALRDPELAVATGLVYAADRLRLAVGS
jgi:hypothetical protein